jgi:hypothetical protein
LVTTKEIEKKRNSKGGEKSMQVGKREKWREGDGVVTIGNE